MKKPNFHFVLFVPILVLICSCTPKTDTAREQKPVVKPLALIMQNKVTGEVLGRKISRPFGVASDRMGNLYLVDEGNNRIIKFDRNFQPLGETGGFGSSDGLLSGPTYITIDNDLSIFVSETGNRRISVFDTRLNFAYSVAMDDESDPFKFGHPAGIALDDYGELWVADADKSHIAIFNKFGNFDRFVGGLEASRGFLQTPGGMTRTADGDIMVCDAGNGVVKAFDKTGVYDFEFGGGILKKPSGIASDRYGNIWIADPGLPGIVCFDRTGAALWSSRETTSPDEMAQAVPRDLAITPDNLVIIADGAHDRLLIGKILYPD